MKHTTKLLLILATVVSTVAFAGAGWAYWTTTGSGSASASVGTLAAPTDVTVPGSSSGSVLVGWTASSTASPNATPQGYYVVRTKLSDGSTAAACNTSSSSLTNVNPCSDLGVPSGFSYKYTVTAVYNSWTAASSLSNAVAVSTVDATPPTQSVSLTPGSGGSYLNGTTVYYKGNAAGSFTLTDTVTDSGSGPASATYPTISGAGWTHNDQTVSTPTNGPYTSTTFSWTSNPGNPSPYTITGKDIAGNTVPTQVTFVNDSTAPTQSLSLQSSGAASLNGTTVSYKGNAAGSFTLMAAITDGGSGPGSATYPTISGAGWTHTTETVVTPTGGPYTSTLFSWASGAAIPMLPAITGKDSVGNTVTTQLTFVNDITGPTVTSISRAAGSPNPTNVGPLSWTVTFSESVKNVLSSNFGLATGGIGGTTPSITSVVPSGSAPSATWTVAVSTTGATGNNSGSIALNLTSAGTIADAVGNALTTTSLTGQTHTYDTTVPTVLNVTLANGSASGNAAGTADDGKGDSLTILYSEQMDATKFCSSWTTPGPKSLSGNGDVTVTIAENGTNDTLTVSSTSCPAFTFGSVALGGNYVATTRTFSGNGGNASTITWDPTAKTLTITLGTRSGTVNSSVAAGTPTYTPAPGLADLAGNSLSTSGVGGLPTTRF